MAKRKTDSLATAKKKAAFLTAFAQTGTITHAARMAKINRNTHYDWMKNERYAQAFVQAQEVATEELEREARRRAIEGVQEPVGFYKGTPGAYVNRYSDTLLIFLLKGARPEKYSERTEISTPKGRPLEVKPIGTFDEAKFYELFRSVAGIGANGHEKAKGNRSGQSVDSP